MCKVIDTSVTLILLIIGTSQSSGNWQNKKTCTAKPISSGANWFSRTDFTKLSDAQTECESGCKKSTECKFANLNWEDAVKKCDLYDHTCKDNMVSSTNNQYVYTRPNAGNTCQYCIAICVT